MKKLLALLLALLALAFGTQAYAWGGHYGGGHYGHGNYGWHGYGHGDYYSSRAHFGFYIGAPLLWPRVEYYRDPYPVTQVIVERQPQVYVQRETPTAASAASNYWYYCPDSRTYYPYAQSCPSPWLQVVPQTSPQVPR